MESGPVKTGKNYTREPVSGRSPHPSPLEEQLKARMDSAGLLSYQVFLETVLYDEHYGYYRAGKQGPQDYCTSPEIHALFGRTIGAYIEDLCDRVQSPSVTILELGGASGKLAADIISPSPTLPWRPISYWRRERKEGRALSDGSTVSIGLRAWKVSPSSWQMNSSMPSPSTG